MKFICKWRFGCWHVYSVDRMSRSISCSLQQGFVHLLVVILSSQSKFLCKGPVNGTTSNIPHSAMFEWSNKIIHAYHSWLTHPGIILAFEFCQGANWNLPHSQKLCSSLHSHSRLGCILRVPEWKSLCWHLHTPLASSLGWSQSFGWSATEFNLQVVWCLTCMNTNLDTVPVPDFYRKHEEHNTVLETYWNCDQRNFPGQLPSSKLPSHRVCKRRRWSCGGCILPSIGSMPTQHL